MRVKEAHSSAATPRGSGRLDLQRRSQLRGPLVACSRPSAGAAGGRRAQAGFTKGQNHNKQPRVTHALFIGRETGAFIIRCINVPAVSRSGLCV